MSNTNENAGSIDELNALLCCPFCGSNNISSGSVAAKDCEGDFYVATACLNCGVEGPKVYEFEINEDFCFDDAANLKWNTRMP